MNQRTRKRTAPAARGSLTVQTAAELLTQGFAALMLAIGLMVLAFSVGAPVFPFGWLGVAACMYAAVRMAKYRQPAPGYAAVWLVMIAMSLAMALPMDY